MDIKHFQDLLDEQVKRNQFKSIEEIEHDFEVNDITGQFIDSDIYCDTCFLRDDALLALTN